MKNAAWLVLLVLVVSSLSSCGSDRDGSDRGLFSDLQHTWENASRRIRGYTPSTDQVSAVAQKQFQDMLSLEYKVVEIDNSASPQKIQEVLTELGADRWECFNILERGASYMIPCRRRPLSLLRYALRFLPVP